MKAIQKESDDAEALYIPYSHSDPDRILSLSGPGPGAGTHDLDCASPHKYTAAPFHSGSDGHCGRSASYSYPVYSCRSLHHVRRPEGHLDLPAGWYVSDQTYRPG